MQRFFAGFATASLLWGVAAGALYVGGFFGQPEGTVLEPMVTVQGAPDAGAALGTKVRRRGVRRASSRAVDGSDSDADRVDRNGGAAPMGEATTGDPLGEGQTRTLDVGASGGEAQLTDAQIERAVDGGMSRIRRCLILVPGDAPVAGRLVFGLELAGSGRVVAVSLSGPAAVTTGDAGDCLRAAARAIGFPSFDGPSMIVHYPLTLE